MTPNLYEKSSRMNQNKWFIYLVTGMLLLLLMTITASICGKIYFYVGIDDGAGAGADVDDEDGCDDDDHHPQYQQQRRCKQHYKVFSYLDI